MGSRPSASCIQESKLPSDPRPSAVPPKLPPQSRGTSALPAGLTFLNEAAPGVAEAALLMCCGSQGWARRMAEHRPYPDLDALLAAADEAAFDLARDDLAEALAAEAGRPASAQPPFDARGSLAAHIALRAAHAAYEAKFRHVFVICLDGLRTDETLDHTLAAIHARLHHEPDEERGVARDELRRLTRGRLVLASAGRCGDAATPTLLR